MKVNLDEFIITPSGERFIMDITEYKKDDNGNILKDDIGQYIKETKLVEAKIREILQLCFSSCRSKEDTILETLYRYQFDLNKKYLKINSTEDIKNLCAIIKDSNIPSFIISFVIGRIKLGIL